MEVYAGWENWQILEHLLGPLSPEEVSRASKLVRIHLQRSSSIPQNLLFVSVTLREPEKPLVLQHINGTYKGPRVQRKAEIVGLSRTECMAFEATVRLADRCIPGNAGIWKTKPPSSSNSFIHPNQLPTSPLSPSAVMASVDCGEYDMMDEMDDQHGSVRREELDVLEEFTWKKDVQPALTPTEYLEVERVIKTHPDIIRVLAERYSIFDIEKEVHVDAWSAGRGYKGEEQDDTTSIRFCKPLLFHCPPLSEGLSPHDINLYSRPIHGITLVVDLMTMKLLRIDQYDVHRKSFPDAITTYWEKPNLKSRRTPPPPPPPFPISSPSTATCEVNNTCCANQIPQQSLLFNNQNAESCCRASQSQLPFPPPSAPHSSSTAATNDSEVNFNPLASLKPLEILQPQGPTFQIKGHLIEWSNWAIRIGFTPREGLVLHQVSYADPDSGRPRSILYRASLAELVVPYGDPTVPNYRKNAFDVGEEGVGINVNSLVLGCDCLGEIYYFDVTLPYCDGSSKVVKNAICLHEEDHGLLWKHTDWRSGHVWSTRSRRLVVSSFCTIANYDYGFFWYFYLDGRIEYEVKLTGILNVDSMDPQSLQEKGVPDYAVLLDNGLYAPVHQHFFGMRLDMMIEGERNWLYEVDAQSDPPDPQTNPQGNSFRIKRRLLSCEEEAQRLLNSESARYWLVTNNQRLNRWKQPVGYRLSPGHNARVLMQPQAPIMRRARFLERHLWATQFSPLERFPAGEYPNQSAGGSGLPWWTYANRPLAGQDLVLWYNFGITHVPRPEEWPIMPICCVGFELIPDNFFDRNPTMMGRQPEKFQSATTPGTVSAARTYSIPAHLPTPTTTTATSATSTTSGHHSSDTSVHNNTTTTSCCKKLTARL